MARSLTDVVGATAWVVDRGRRRLRDGPLVPDLLGVLAAPPVALEQLVPLDHNGHAEREVDGEPAEHALGVGLRVDGHTEAVVELAVEVASKTMHQRIDLHGEADLRVPVVALQLPVGVREGEACTGLPGGVEGLVEPDDICRLEMGQVAIVLHVVPELRAGDGRKEGRIAAGDAHAVGRQEALCTVQALGREFVVAKGA
mmetsp:Transcript_88566/g.274251  ORF Transcript_88566/g.274251 Transcript_88566/m.274251 type:complete len:200 (-) Transcript_88566:1395-1994(-)